jgi:hypothetical protein
VPTLDGNNRHVKYYLASDKCGTTYGAPCFTRCGDNSGARCSFLCGACVVSNAVSSVMPSPLPKVVTGNFTMEGVKWASLTQQRRTNEKFQCPDYGAVPLKDKDP